MKKSKQIKIDTFPKLITTTIIIHGMVTVTLSYVLAFMGKDTVADVSVAIIGEILAPICVYLVTNCIANIFEKNRLSFSLPLNSEGKEGKGNG